MLLKAVRNGLGYLIILGDHISRPTPITRSSEDQALAQSRVDGHTLYQLKACPFCVKTRRALHQLSVEVDLKDIGRSADHRAELQAGGGRIKVPCLRIEDSGQTRWMYESNDIIQYLQQRVA